MLTHAKFKSTVSVSVYFQPFSYANLRTRSRNDWMKMLELLNATAVLGSKRKQREKRGTRIIAPPSPLLDLRFCTAKLVMMNPKSSFGSTGHRALC